MGTPKGGPLAWTAICHQPSGHDEVIYWLGFYNSTKLQQTLGNGNYITPLNFKVIAKAVAKAPNEPLREPPPWQMAHKESPAQAVIVKKRRGAALP